MKKYNSMVDAWTFSIDETGMTPPGLLHNLVISYDGTNPTITDSAGSNWTTISPYFEFDTTNKMLSGRLQCSSLKSAAFSLEIYFIADSDNSPASTYIYKGKMADTQAGGWGYSYDNGSVTVPSGYTNIPTGVSVSRPAYITPYIPGANSNTCFVAGTPVDTDQGPIAIEQLDHNTNTINGKPIVAISKITSTDSHIIFLKANCLGPNQPSQDTTVSKLHKILYNGIMFPALNLPNVKQIPYDGQPLYNVLLENYAIMTVNNLTVETLHPRSNIAVLYKYITTNNIDTVEKNKLIGLLNNKLDKTNKLRKAFFSNIVTVIMLNILTEPKEEQVKVTPYSLIKSFIPNAAFVTESNPLF